MKGSRAGTIIGCFILMTATLLASHVVVESFVPAFSTTTTTTTTTTASSRKSLLLFSPNSYMDSLSRPPSAEQAMVDETAESSSSSLSSSSSSSSSAPNVANGGHHQQQQPHAPGRSGSYLEALSSQAGSSNSGSSTNNWSSNPQPSSSYSSFPSQYYPQQTSTTTTTVPHPSDASLELTPQPPSYEPPFQSTPASPSTTTTSSNNNNDNNNWNNYNPILNSNNNNSNNNDSNNYYSYTNGANARESPQQSPPPHQKIPSSGSYLDALSTSSSSTTTTTAATTTTPDTTKTTSSSLSSNSATTDWKSYYDSSSSRRNNPSSMKQSTGMAERILKRVPAVEQGAGSSSNAGGAGSATTWEAFQKAEEEWSNLKLSKRFQYDYKYLGKFRKGVPPPDMFVSTDVAIGKNPACWNRLREQRDLKKLDYDILVCGGTLGIFYATALQRKGHRVCVIEGKQVQGREQEWNISMDELMELVRLNILSHRDIDAAIQTEFPGCRAGFKNKEATPLFGGYFDNEVGYECVVEGVLNLGVSPSILIERTAQRFQQLGGVIMSETPLYGIAISESVGVAADLGRDKVPVTAELVIDCMGNGSPICKQQRYGQKPDGICVVVGSCAGGYDPETNLFGDIIYTFDTIQDKGKNGKMQYFWESFPVGIGRNGKEPGTSDVKTTYMFTYMDADKKRPSLESIMEDYWRLLPTYQPSIQNPETDLDVKRVLFAFFPSYKDSPLKPAWNRVLPVGDASGIQSPLSFGGFAAMTRHLGRISDAIDEAITDGLLHKDDLSKINQYIPNLSAAWMFQRAMSVRMGQNVSPDFVNRLLAVNFEEMDKMGDKTIKPFLQDIIRFDGLASSLANSFSTDPYFMPQIIKHVGLPTLAEWFGHVGMIGAYGFLDSYGSPVAQKFVENNVYEPREQFTWNRRFDAWKYGSGHDYDDAPGND